MDNMYLIAGQAILKYSSTGVPMWTNQFGGDQEYAITLDHYGTVFVTGEARDTIDPFCYLTVAYSSSGTPLWTNRYAGTGNGNNEATAIAVGTNDDVFVTGYASFGMYPAYNYRYTTIKYAATKPGSIPLGCQRSDATVVLTWTNSVFVLQSANDITGPFTNVPSATSPYTNALTGAQKFFRLISN